MYLKKLKQLQETILSDRDSVSFYNWMYEDGVLLKGLLRANEITEDKRTFPFVKEYIDTFVDSEGRIAKIESRPPSVDSLNNGKIIIEMYRKYGEERYFKALCYIYDRIKEHPRINGLDAFAHKAIYKDQMWLDGLYMLQPLYAELINIFNEPDLYAHVAKQFVHIDRLTYDREAKLFYHACDYSRKMFWCDRKTGCSLSFWGRAIGWLSMAVIDTYEIISEEFAEERTILESLANKLADGIIQYQNKNGVWYQVVDKGGKKGNYEESSSSCMFAYFFMRGINKGLLPELYSQYAKKAVDGIMKEFVVTDNLCKLHINNVCQVAGLGPDKKPYRDGSFSYYISEPVVADDNKARGPLLLLLCELAGKTN